MLILLLNSYIFFRFLCILSQIKTLGATRDINLINYLFLIPATHSLVLLTKALLQKIPGIPPWGCHPGSTSWTLWMHQNREQLKALVQSSPSHFILKCRLSQGGKESQMLQWHLIETTYFPEN